VSDAFITAAVRTPIGRAGGALAEVRPDDLAAIVIRSLLERGRIPAHRIDDVIFGCANQAGEDNRNVARMAALLAGASRRSHRRLTRFVPVKAVCSWPEAWRA